MKKNNYIFSFYFKLKINKMFNDQERKFLQTIQEMLYSTDRKYRQKAETDINIWAKDSYIEILSACNKFIINENLDINTRRYACYIITLLLKEKYYKNWGQLPQELRDQLKINSLSLLGNDSNDIRITACSLVSEIYMISIKKNEWDNLIRILCNACGSGGIEFKLASIKTIGFILEKLNKTNFSENDLVMIEDTLIKTLLSAYKEKSLIYECLTSYQHFINYTFNKFNDNEYLKNTLQMLMSFCNKNEYNEKIQKISIHCISDVILLAYDNMEKLINYIIEFLGEICKDENENLAIQGYVALIELSQEEYYRKLRNKNCKNYIDTCWDIIWPVIQNTLNNDINPQYINEMNSYRSLSDLLYYISKICKENIIDDIFIYMKEKIPSENPFLINSSLYLFSSILESVHRQKLKEVINSCIDVLCEFFQSSNEILKETISWCIEKICENFGELIIRSGDIFDQIINLIIENIKDEGINKKIKIYLCISLYKLIETAKNSELINLGIFDKYFSILLKVLNYLAFLPNSYDINNNLSRYCFIAISGLIKINKKKNDEILKYYSEQLTQRFEDACYIKNFLNNKQYQYQIEDSLCILIVSFCNRNNSNKFSYTQIDAFFNYIQTFFKNRGIFEIGLIALSKLALLVSNKELINYMKIIMDYIYLCLKDYQDYSNCKTALFCLIDLIAVSKQNFEPYIEKLKEFFEEILKKPDANKELFSYFLIIYSGLFEFVGECIWKYAQSIFDYMNFVLEFCINNIEQYLAEGSNEEDTNFFLHLNNNVVDLISNILKRIKLETIERKKVFYKFSKNIIYYINFIFAKDFFQPDNDYIIFCINNIYYLITIYGNESLKYFKNETIKKIEFLSLKSDNYEVINSYKYLENYKNSFIFNFEINNDD